MEILVLNSDLMERSVIQQVLEHSQHKVTFTDNSENALKHIAGGNIRFVIADVTAVEENNIKSLVQKVRNELGTIGHIYVLLLTPKGQNSSLLANPGTGADDYLNKPVVPQELKARVKVGERILSMGDTLTQARDQLENLAMYDTLTGLLNRKAFYIVAQGELERARRNSEGVSVIAMDIDNLKDINQRHGRQIGDEVLQIVGQIIREKSRPYDCIGRWAGDQFTIALPGVISTDAEKIANRVLDSIKTSQISLDDGTQLHVMLSVGIVSSMNINAYAEIENYIQRGVEAVNTSKKSAEDIISVVFL